MKQHAYCRKGHLYPPNVAFDERGSRICMICRGSVLCAQCHLRPVSRKGHPFCSKACSNSSRKRPLAERFLDFYRPGATDACWPWAGPCDKSGYGVITDDHRRQLRAHRVSYERINGPVPDGKNVCHRCDNPPCCNPSHLWIGTFADNNEDKRLKDRVPFGESHHMAKLTEQNVRDIRAMYPGMSQQAIANQFGVNQTIVSDIVRRVTWKRIME